MEERAVDLAEDELVAHGAVGHHAEGVVDDATVAAPSQLRRRPACTISGSSCRIRYHFQGNQSAFRDTDRCRSGAGGVDAPRFICYEKTGS